MAMTTSVRRAYQQICGDGRSMMVIAADQRGGMREVLADTPEARKAITDRRLGEVKVAIARNLAVHAGCILVDPLCAVPWMVDDGLLPRDTALLIGLDASGYDSTPEGWRLSKLVPGVTAREVRRMGATGGKIMVYLRPDTPGADDHNIAILRQVIADFAAEDLLLVTEFLTYALPGESPDAYKATFPALIEAGSRICLDLGAHILKIPFPGTAAAFAAAALATLSVVVGASVTEELYFRGVLYGQLAARFARAAAVVGSAGAFGLVHFQPDAFPTLFALGLILGLLRLRTGSIWPPIAMHAANNGLAFTYLLAT